jgi:hypothetical protein
MKILLPVILTFGVTALADLSSKGSVRLSIFLGSAVYGLLIVAASEINAEIALAFAWVVAITALLTSGQTVFTAIAKGF